MQKQQPSLPIYRVYRHGGGFCSQSAHSFLYLDNSHNLFYRSYTGDADSAFVRAHNLNVA